MSKTEQVSNSFALCVVMTVAGGFLDAYTYIVRGGVFANTQTGNIVQCGMALMNGDLFACLRYLLSILAFTLGIFLVVYIRDIRHIQGLHWRQETVLIEAVILLIVAFLPESRNTLANTLVAFACGIQLQTFRKVGEYTYTTTMATGNLRSFAYALVYSLNTGEEYYAKRAAVVGSLLLMFMLGAGLGGIFSRMMGVQAVMIPCALLAFSIVAMR